MTSAEGLTVLKDPLIGQIIQGRYRVGRAIGKGGMGVVYEARHMLIGRKVAVKTLGWQASLSPASVQRFRREARAAAAVGSSHIVDVLDMGQLPDDSFFIVLEHLDGVDLGFAVAQQRRFSVGRAVNVVCQLCDALSAVHAAGIVHRDLKPENIFLTVRDGTPDFVKVLDFGVCKFNDGCAPRLTATGDAVGTPLFMAPEQVEGHPDVDHRTDIYALGAILYFALTGRTPFGAANLPKLFVKICNEPPPSVRALAPGLPVALDAVIQRALSKLPDRRYASCAELKSALLPFAAGPRDESGVALLAPAITDSAGGAKPERDTAALVETLALRRPKSTGALIAAFAGLGALIAGGAHFARNELRATRTQPAAVQSAPTNVPPIVGAARPASEPSDLPSAATAAPATEAPSRAPEHAGRPKAEARRMRSSRPAPKGAGATPPSVSAPAPTSATPPSTPPEAGANDTSNASSATTPKPATDSGVHLNKGPKDDPL